MHVADSARPENSKMCLCNCLSVDLIGPCKIQNVISVFEAWLLKLVKIGGIESLLVTTFDPLDLCEQLPVNFLLLACLQGIVLCASCRPQAQYTRPPRTHWTYPREASM